MNKDEALRLALEALGHFEKAGLATLKTIDAITAIKQALEQPEPEPVAWMWKDGTITADSDRADGTWTPLYTSPPKREWQRLTDDEIDLLEDLYAPPVHPDFVNDADHCTELIRHVEAKLKEKNT